MGRVFFILGTKMEYESLESMPYYKECSPLVEGLGYKLVELKVGPSDMGKVIGKQGRIAKAIRTVMRAAANKADMNIAVEID